MSTAKLERVAYIKLIRYTSDINKIETEPSNQVISNKVIGPYFSDELQNKPFTWWIGQHSQSDLLKVEYNK